MCDRRSTVGDDFVVAELGDFHEETLHALDAAETLVDDHGRVTGRGRQGSPSAVRVSSALEPRSLALDLALLD